MKVCINGKFVPAKDAKISVFDQGFTSGYGIYETLLVKNGIVFDVDAHVDRLFKSAEIVGLKLPFPRTRISGWVKKTAEFSRKGIFRLRITASFGTEAKGPAVVIFTRPLKLPARAFFKAITCKIERILPAVKTTCLLPQYLARREMARRRADEVFLVNHKNEITEGSVTNVFFVRRGVLITPKKDILIGTMRGNAIRAAKKLKIPVRERSVKKTELKNFSECFVTNSLIRVVPVLSIDGGRISGKIGPLTKQIRDYVRKEDRKS